METYSRRVLFGELEACRMDLLHVSQKGHPTKCAVACIKSALTAFGDSDAGLDLDGLVGKYPYLQTEGERGLKSGKDEIARFWKEKGNYECVLYHDTPIVEIAKECKAQDGILLLTMESDPGSYHCVAASTPMQGYFKRYMDPKKDTVCNQKFEDIERNRRRKKTEGEETKYCEAFLIYRRV